jgi:two-component system CheB/CheR fusion protein
MSGSVPEVNGGEASGGVERRLTLVGIGASAGGLEAIQSFFEKMPVDSGAAFVVIQHLSPDHKSLMAELLGRKTTMPVQRAEEGLEITPNHVYLIPPKRSLTVFHGKLLLREQRSEDGLHLPVDIFFRSMAEDCAERCVGVVLSGTGSDGTRGVRAIKEAGGLVMVQDEDSAQFNGMPRAAAATGLADFVLPPDTMPDQLMAYLKHPYVRRGSEAERKHGDPSLLTRVFAMLRAKTKVDFTYYKPSTILRRIERRISVTQVDDLAAYVAYLEDNATEITTLYRELLIGVTSFMRDPEVMREAQQHIRGLLQGSSGRELRFWVAGCSTGEEAYTLAILARETMDQLGLSRDLKIFATDIDRHAIVSAGNGVYPESVAADLRPDWLTKFFYRRGQSFHIARHIREMVVFAQHNLVKDPPFTNIDLVSCRNLLIYLQPNLQRRALEMFNFSLRQDGLLLLGTSETIGDMEDYFEPLQRRYKLYRSRGRHGLPRSLSAADSDAQRMRIQAGSVRGTDVRSRNRAQEQMLERLLDTLGAHVIPLAVVVNEHLHVVHVVGDASPYFRIPSGQAVLDVSRMVDRELAIPLTTGIQKTFREHKEMIYNNVRLRRDEAVLSLRIRILPVPGRGSQDALVLVMIEAADVAPVISAAAGDAIDMDADVRQRLEDMEQELQFTRENLQATIEELETSNEELQATNEELLASNEELQSTNEELQSTNEELYTVNAEYQDKITELTEANNDVENLLSSARVGTLLLDEDLHIRRFSPELASVFHILEKDVGRPVAHLTHVLMDFDPAAEALLVQQRGKAVERQVQSGFGKWFLLRITPYSIGSGMHSGVVLTTVDISSLKDIEARLERSHMLRFFPDCVLIYQADAYGALLLESANRKALDWLEGEMEAVAGKRFEDTWPHSEAEDIAAKMRTVLKTGSCLHMDQLAVRRAGARLSLSLHAFVLQGERLAISFTPSASTDASSTKPSSHD